MLVHEARARFEGRAPEFGNADDRQAVTTLALYHQAVKKARVTHASPKHLEKKLQDFEQSDALTLETYLHRRLVKQRGRRHGR